MSAAVLESKTAMRKLAKKAQETVDDTSMTLAERKSVLDDIQVEMKTHSGLISAYEESMRLATGGDAAEEAKSKNDATIKSVGQQVLDSVGYKSINDMLASGARTKMSHVAQIKTVNTIDEGAVLDANGFPTGMGGAAVIPQFLPGITEIRTRRLLVAELFAAGTTSAASISYLKELAWQNMAAGTAEKAKKPQSDLTVARLVEQVGKITNRMKVTDELMQDAPGLMSFIQSRLLLGVDLAEDFDLLNAAYPGYPTVGGLLARPGMSQTIAASGTAASGGPVNVIDKIYNQITQLRSVAFVEPDAAVFNPADWQNIRLAKDDNNQYYGGGPFTGAYGNGGFSNVDALWGLRVVQTPAMPVGTALVGGYQECAQLFRRQGLTVEMTNSNEDDFNNNLISMRAEKREALVVYRPSGFGKVTLAWS